MSTASSTKGGADELVYFLDWSAAGGRGYVGKTNDLERRLASHRKSERNAAVRQAFMKYGDPKITILHRCKMRAETFVLEPFEIHRLGTLSPGGYNMTAGAEGRTVQQVREWTTHPDFSRLSAEARAAWQWFIEGPVPRGRATSHALVRERGRAVVGDSWRGDRFGRGG